MSSLPAPLIAIVDDDTALREALADLIEVFGYQAAAFGSGESFLAAHAPGRFGCLITDLNLMGESGVQLRQRLETVEPSLPVIIISAQTDAAARARALRAGAHAYLTKPIKDQVLLRHLISALGRAAPQA
jgi:FixJ family two-component response regulator